MSDDCIFCAIVAGEIPARTVYEDDHVIAFLDANPLSRGHTLVIPKEHHGRVVDLPPETNEALFSTVGALSPGVANVVDADGTTIGFNDGAVAGQEIPHVHGHIVPRFEGDGGGAIHSIVSTRPDLTDEELDGIAAEIADAAGGV